MTTTTPRRQIRSGLKFKRRPEHPDAEQPRAPRRPPSRSTREIVIRPSAVSFWLQLQELWQYRDLFVVLVWRNIRMEFDATRLGSMWAIARPLMFAFVFSMFRNLSGADTRVDLPYMVYIYSGLLLWTYFTDAATNSASAIRMDMALLSKIYYPRLLTPCVPTVASLLTLLIGMVPLAFMMAWYGVHPGWPILLLPIALIPCIVLALGLGIIVSSLTIENRDWERVLGYALTIGLWLSPVIYAPDMIPRTVHDLYHVNPMAGILLGFRAVLFDGFPMPIWEWLYALVSSFAILAIGIWMFRRTELRLIDRL